MNPPRLPSSVKRTGPFGRARLCNHDLLIGVKAGYIPSLQPVKYVQKKTGYNFVCANVRDVNDDSWKDGRRGLGEVRETVFDWCENQTDPTTLRIKVVGTLSDLVKDFHEKKLKELEISRLWQSELEFYTYLNLCAVLVELHEPILPHVANLLLATFVQSATRKRGNIPKFWVHVKLGQSFGPDSGLQNSWELYHTCWVMADRCENMVAVLELTKDFPSQHELMLWGTEEYSGLIISSEVFLHDTFMEVKTRPYLSGRHQKTVENFMLDGMPQVIIHCNGKEPCKIKHYKYYIRKTWESLKDKQQSEAIPTPPPTQTVTPPDIPAAREIPVEEYKMMVESGQFDDI